MMMIIERSISDEHVSDERWTVESERALISSATFVLIYTGREKRKKNTGGMTLYSFQVSIKIIPPSFLFFHSVVAKHGGSQSALGPESGVIKRGMHQY